jgi:hypothetical protein
MKIILSTSDIIDILEKEDSEFVNKIKVIINDSIDTLMNTPELQEKATKIAEAAVRARINDVIHEAIKSKGWNYSDIDGWGARLLKEELIKTVSGIDIQDVINKAVQGAFANYARDALQVMFNKEIRDVLDSKLTDERIIKATQDVIDRRLKGSL